MASKLLRHGDVILIELLKRPEGNAEPDCVLAEGEVTGHSHRIEEGAEKVAFDPSNATHQIAKTSAVETIKERWAIEFPNEPFPFSEEEIEIGWLVRVNEPTELRHQEHGKIALARGENFAVIIQRDYTPKGWQKVID